MSTVFEARSAHSRFSMTGLALLLMAGSGIGILWARQSRRVGNEAKSRSQEAAAGARVRVATAEQKGGAGWLTVQGEAQPYVSATLYPKVSGFLRQIGVDKGSPVRKGQVLAVLEASETDRDAAALRADYENKRRTAERHRALARDGILSAQALEDSEAAARVAKERLASQSVVQGYQRVVAPFSGVITQRFADPGALLQNGGATSAAQPLVNLAQVDRLRVVLHLDQQAAARVQVGTPVDVFPAGRPDLMRKIRISRRSGAVDPRTRTLSVEADLDNGDSAFLPGGAITARLQVPQVLAGPRVPSEAVFLRESKPCLAIVSPDQRLVIRQVLLGDDTGSWVQVLSGLNPGERVILSPAITLKDGDRVVPVETPGAGRS